MQLGSYGDANSESARQGQKRSAGSSPFCRLPQGQVLGRTAVCHHAAVHSDSLAAYAPAVNEAAAMLAQKCTGASRVAGSTDSCLLTAAVTGSDCEHKPTAACRQVPRQHAAGRATDATSETSAPFNITDAFAEYAMEVVGGTAFGCELPTRCHARAHHRRSA